MFFVTSWSRYGAVGFEFAGRTPRLRRIAVGFGALAGVSGVLKAVESRSGSSKFAFTSILVPRGSVNGFSNQ